MELLVRGALQEKKKCTSAAAWLCQESLKYQHITTLHARRTAPYIAVRTRPLPTRDACYDRGSKHTLADFFFLIARLLIPISLERHLKNIFWFCFFAFFSTSGLWYCSSGFTFTTIIEISFWVGYRSSSLVCYGRPLYLENVSFQRPGPPRTIECQETASQGKTSSDQGFRTDRSPLNVFFFRVRQGKSLDSFRLSLPSVKR